MGPLLAASISCIVLGLRLRSCGILYTGFDIGQMCVGWIEPSMTVEYRCEEEYLYQCRQVDTVRENQGMSKPKSSRTRSQICTPEAPKTWR